MEIHNMKRVILPMTALAAFSLSASSFAVNNSNTTSTATLSAQVNNLSAETKKLEHEVWLLKHKKHHVAKKPVNTAQNSVQSEQLVDAKNTPSANKYPWEHFVTVTTTPFLGTRTDYDGDDLLFNVPSNNEDLRLLEQKAKLDTDMHQHGYSLDRPILQVSGAVEGEGFSQSGFNTNNTSGINLSTAELNFNAIASSWASAYMSLSYTSAPISTGNREPNSTIYLSRGFATIGNLNKFPVYFTAGLMYTPFGRYANALIDTPLTESLFKIRTPAALLGFSLNNGLRGSIYGYSGSQTSGGQPIFKQWGVDSGYKYKFGQGNHLSLGAGWVSNVADSEGMQGNGLAAGGAQFAGFGTSTATSTNNNALVHSVDGIDGHATLAVGPFSVIGEYLGALERFNTADLTYNSAGAQPQAINTEVDYELPFFAKKYGTTVGVSYGQTWQALALNLPAQSYIAYVNTSIWRETIESLEFRHDVDYTTGDVATGRGATTNIVGTGRTRNSVLLQVGVYF
jgi:hypothetical protein